MQQRLQSANVPMEAFQPLLKLHQYVRQSGLESRLLHLVYLRASQVNGCAYCIDMHWKDLREEGVPEQDLYMLDAWREWPGYSPRERAALAWTEAVTALTTGFVPDSVFEAAREQFSERELVDLTFAVVAINSFNRLNVAFRRKPGTYVPGSAE